MPGPRVPLGERGRTAAVGKTHWTGQVAVCTCCGSGGHGSLGYFCLGLMILDLGKDWKSTGKRNSICIVGSVSGVSKVSA